MSQTMMPLAPAHGDLEHVPCFFSHCLISRRRDNRWSQKNARKKKECGKLKYASKYEIVNTVLQNITMCCAFQSDRIIVFMHKM